MNVPFWGVKSCSASSEEGLRLDEEELIHRWGRQTRESGPQYLGCVCRDCRLGTTRVLAGMARVTEGERRRGCGWEDVCFGMPGMGLKRRRVSN